MCKRQASMEAGMEAGMMEAGTIAKGRSVPYRLVNKQKTIDFLLKSQLFSRLLSFLFSSLYFIYHATTSFQSIINTTVFLCHFWRAGMPSRSLFSFGFHNHF